MWDDTSGTEILAASGSVPANEQKVPISEQATSFITIQIQVEQGRLSEPS